MALINITMKKIHFQKLSLKSLTCIIALSFLLYLPVNCQDRVDVYHHYPVTETSWMNSTFNSIGVSYYPSASLYNPTTQKKSDVPMYYFDLRMLTFNPDKYQPVSAGISLGYYMTTPADGDQKFNGGDLNLCLFHLPKNIYTSTLSMYGGVIAGVGIGTTTYFHGEGSLGFIMPLGESSQQALSLDIGYNFSKYLDKGTSWYVEPGLFFRVAFCFGRGAGYVTTTTVY